MRKKWYIYGAGGLGIETVDYLMDRLACAGEDDIACEFIDDNCTTDNRNGIPIVTLSDTVRGSKVTIAVGEPSLRSVLYKRAKDAGLELSSIISPKAYVSSLSEIGEGTIIAPFCSVQATASIGANVSVNTASIIGHDVKIERDCVISSMVNLGGGVKIGSGSFCGMGALIKEGVAVGASTIIGMGSVLHKDVPDDVIALGDPARVMRRNEKKSVFGK